MKTLIAIAMIEAGLLGQNSPAVPVGGELTVESDELAAKLVSDGVAKEKDVPETSKDQPPESASKSKQIKVRLLVDSIHGKCNQVVALDINVAKGAEKQGLADSDKNAVAYAEQLAASK